ncbi:hypothetical protein FV222_18640 [Methylobacterium sp. WL103]|uniref:hypothetical protein n=1 Tax=Methylobacterium sp. WL103 TaxID=2603891 RepID=UPI0011C919BC|nr:hypothetical protein [Methylobacterium sp. WL103]TXM96260.1 hypothetical protein FV222_18640 [Methylobacterium sp. WL103]
MNPNLTDAGKPLYPPSIPRPSVGRIVHYRPDPRTASRKSGDWAAIITETYPTEVEGKTYDVVFLTVFPSGEAPRPLENPTPYFDPEAPAREDTWGTWHFPERV